MTSHPAAPLLAADLGSLPHTNARGERGLIHIPGFLSTAGANPEQVAQAGLLAQGIAEGIIEDLEKHGYQVIHKAEIAAQVKAEAAAKQNTGELTLHCNRCRRPVLEVDVSAENPKLHLATAIAGLSAHMAACR
jgi:hypothetical protein